MNTGTSIRVELGDRSYPVVVADSDAAAWTNPLKGFAGRSVAVVTDANVDTLYHTDFRRCLADAGIERYSWHVVPAGETSKSQIQLSRLYDALFEVGFGRNDVVCAFGGGVVGDLAGFLAASIHRGVDFVQMPTTLLAMADSSVGGKTGINHKVGKNLIGAFHQPVVVGANLRTLATLEKRQLASGLAEVIKYGVIWDPALFERLKGSAKDLVALKSTQLLAIVEASVRIKAEVVRRDERESGLRMILNFGHTLGHAIERTAGYGDWFHGEAVAAGMVLAAELGEEKGLTPAGIGNQIRDLCSAFDLPTEISAERRRCLMKAVRHDKKVRNQSVKFIFARRLGEVSIEDLELDELDHWLAR